MVFGIYYFIHPLISMEYAKTILVEFQYLHSTQQTFSRSTSTVEATEKGL